MALKSVREFNEFNLKRFLEGKELGFMSAEPWIDKDKNVLGTKVNVVIKSDNTKYKKDDVSNEGSQFVVKVPGRYVAQYDSYQMFLTNVNIVNVVKATLWGDFMNEVSIEAIVLSDDELKQAQQAQQQR